MHHLAGGSSRLDIYGGTGGNGGSSGGQGGVGGVGLGPSFGGMQFLIQNPQLDSSYPLAANTGPSQAVTANSQLSASGMGTALLPHASRQNTASSQVAVHSESENYCSQLLGRGRGYPLYVPTPQVNLPAEYRRGGVTIGDVGRVTPEGGFSFFFNIYLPATHPINKHVPEDFVPLSPYEPADVACFDFEPGNYVSSPTVIDVNNEFSEFPGGKFVFSCAGPSGAVLCLPHGAHLERLEHLQSVRRYAAKHAESWYKYINVTRGRELVNGNLYLITGCEKARSWGMAIFQDVSLQTNFQLSFRPIPGCEGCRYRWQGTHCHRKYADSPPDGTSLNQTTFIHAFAISVGERIWEKLFGVEVCQPVDDPSTVLDRSGRGFIPYGTQGSSFLWSLFFGTGASSGGKQCSECTVPAPALGNGIVTEVFPAPKVIHPSQIIHERIFREVPQAKVVITHDDDWRDVLKDDGVQTQRLTASELQEAIFNRFEIMEEDGAVFLTAKSGPTASRNAATITVEELHPIDDQITNDPRDDLNLLSQKDLREISEQKQDRNTAEGDIRPNSTDNARVQLDPVLDMWNFPSSRAHPRARVSSYSDRSEPGLVDHWRSPGIEIPQISVGYGCREFTMSGGGSMDSLVSVGLSSSRSVVLTDAEEAELYNIQNRNTGTKSVFGMQYPSPIHPAGRGGVAPTQYQVPSNARFPGYRQPAPNSEPEGPFPGAAVRDSDLEESTSDDFPTYFTERDGRLYHSHGGSPYPLPVDTPEQERMKIQHQALFELMGDYYPESCPVPEVLAHDPDRQGFALDLCTGTGVWAMDMARRFPHIAFRALDIVPIATRYPHPNVEFSLHDVNTPTTWAAGHFDFIHARSVTMAVTAYPNLLHEVLRLLHPRGLFLSGEWGRYPAFHPDYAQRSPVAHTPALVAFFAHLHAALALRGLHPVAPLMAPLLAHTGAFDEITAKEYYMPIGSWHPDKAMQRLGRAFRAVYRRYMASVHPMLIESGVVPADELDDLYERVERELAEVEGLVFVFHTVYARKI